MATAASGNLVELEDGSVAKKTSTRSEKTSPPREKPLFLRLPPAYHEALASLARKGRRTLTAEAMMALEDYFAKHGVGVDPGPRVD